MEDFSTFLVNVDKVNDIHRAFHLCLWKKAGAVKIYPVKNGLGIDANHVSSG